MSFSDRLTKAFQGASPSEIAAALEVPYETVRSYYNKVDRMPNAEILIRIAEQTHVDLYWLLTGKPAPGSTESDPAIPKFFEHRQVKVVQPGNLGAKFYEIAEKIINKRMKQIHLSLEKELEQWMSDADIKIEKTVAVAVREHFRFKIDEMESAIVAKLHAAITDDPSLSSFFESEEEDPEETN